MEAQTVVVNQEPAATNIRRRHSAQTPNQRRRISMRLFSKRRADCRSASHAHQLGSGRQRLTRSATREDSEVSSEWCSSSNLACEAALIELKNLQRYIKTPGYEAFIGRYDKYKSKHPGDALEDLSGEISDLERTLFNDIYRDLSAKKKSRTSVANSSSDRMSTITPDHRVGRKAKMFVGENRRTLYSSR